MMNDNSSSQKFCATSYTWGGKQKHGCASDWRVNQLTNVSRPKFDQDCDTRYWMRRTQQATREDQQR